jgi:hypothetical protein
VSSPDPAHQTAFVGREVCVCGRGVVSSSFNNPLFVRLLLVAVKVCKNFSRRGLAYRTNLSNTIFFFTDISDDQLLSRTWCGTHSCHFHLEESGLIIYDEKFDLI